jgi:hypothetical protein
MAMRLIFWGFCRNWVLMDSLHYLSSRSASGFEFAEIFVKEKQLSHSATVESGSGGGDTGSCGGDTGSCGAIPEVALLPVRDLTLG